MRKKCKAIGQDSSVINKTPPTCKYGAVTYSKHKQIAEGGGKTENKEIVMTIKDERREAPPGKKGGEWSTLCSIGQTELLWPQWRRLESPECQSGNTPRVRITQPLAPYSRY
jgi:hypothetical protein